MNIERKPCSKL